MMFRTRLITSWVVAFALGGCTGTAGGPANPGKGAAPQGGPGGANGGVPGTSVVGGKGGGQSSAAGIGGQSPPNDAAGSGGGNPVSPPVDRLCIEKGDVVAPRPQALRGVFFASCSGCHGVEGDGVGKFPALHKDLGFEAFAKVVRDGREGSAGVMPSFSKAHLPDGELLQLYATLTGKNVVADQDVGCSESTPLSTADVERAFQTGLQAWRLPGREGAACAGCHGPMPVDLAYIGYDDATIFRRGLKHLTEEQTRQVVNFVHAIRAKYGMSGPKDFLRFRPFQPGGQALAGATPAERDHRFGRNLAQVAPTLFEGTVDTASKAMKARDEMLAINPRNFPIGVELNRWSEDMHHGIQHATFNDWIPDRPRVPISPAAAATLYALHDDYIRNPSWNSLWAIRKRLDELTTITGMNHSTPPGSQYAPFAGRMYKLKYDSVLFAQHNFLQEAQGLPTLAGMSASPFPDQNSLWELGDLARVNNNVVFATDCNNSWMSCLGLPADAVAQINPALDPKDELSSLRMSWFWVGWFFDLTLHQTSNTNSTKSSEYFTGQLYDGYYNHVVYHRIRKNLASAYEVTAPVPDADGQPDVTHPWAHTYGYYMAYDRGLVDSKMPPSPDAKSLYKTFAGNTLRMMLLLATEAIQRTGRVANKTALLASYGSDSPFMQFTKLHSADVAKDLKLVDDLRAAIAKACESRPLGYKEAVYSGHCDFKN